MTPEFITALVGVGTLLLAMFALHLRLEHRITSVDRRLANLEGQMQIWMRIPRTEAAPPPPQIAEMS